MSGGIQADFLLQITDGLRLGIIGTAGRQDDAARLSRKSWEWMCRRAWDHVVAIRARYLVSGGAAWADHVAVQMALGGVIRPENLTLHLPARITATGFVDVQPSLSRFSPATIANRYHAAFSHKIGRDTIADLLEVERRGARLTVNARGFKARNTEIAVGIDRLLAFTFGRDDEHAVAPISAREFPADTSAAQAGVKGEGTADTWNKARCPKTHIRLGGE